MGEFNDLIKKIITIRDDRDWQQFHNPKDMALSLSLEAAEVLEHFQWKNGKELKTYISKNKSEIGKELADVLYWTLLMSHDLEIDLYATAKEKLKETERKYPIEKAKGKSTKYDKL